MTPLHLTYHAVINVYLWITYLRNKTRKLLRTGGVHDKLTLKLLINNNQLPIDNYKLNYKLYHWWHTGGTLF